MKRRKICQAHYEIVPPAAQLTRTEGGSGKAFGCAMLFIGVKTSSKQTSWTFHLHDKALEVCLESGYIKVE